jgi:hypothetical protein
MRENKFVEFLEKRNQSEEAIEAAVNDVKDFEMYLAASGSALEMTEVDDIKGYMKKLIKEERNTMERLVALARYFYVTGHNEVFIYFTGILNGREVIPSISRRLSEIAGEETRERVFEGVQLPPLGSPPEEVPVVTALLVERLMDLGTETCHKVLAGNHHGIPEESFVKHKKWLEEEGSIDGFLERMHDEAVAELDQHSREGRIWYEQEITPEVVEFVRGNPEVLSAVRDGEYLYITKIPYAPKEWLKETDPVTKRYLACHCPLARAAIIMGGPEIPLDWCYCSGGFTKLKFDVVFEEPTEVEVLESVLAGDERCRFRIKIPDSAL